MRPGYRLRYFSFVQALLAVFVCVLPRSAGAEPQEPISGFAFDGIGGYVFIGETDILGAHRNISGSSAVGSQLDLGGVLRTGFRYSNLNARLGIAGFLFAPHRVGRENFSDRLVSFAPGIDEAALRLAFPRFGPSAALEFGVFRFQSNADAALFGEYLMRYGAYPGSVERAPLRWDYSLGSLAGRVEALRLTWGGPRLRSDFLWLFDSSAVDGHADFSYALFLEGTFPRGFTWGAGGELFRAQSSEPEGLTSHSSRNGYVKTDSGYVLLYDLPYDTAPRPREDTGYFTRSAAMFSLRAAADFGDLFGMEGEGVGGWWDWRLFTEAALLGWGNQPLIYEDRWSRLAWTFGVHVPTGGWLDDLCVQAERHPSHYRLVFSPPINGMYRPGPIEREPEKWKFGALASKTVWGWLAVQFRYLYQPVMTSSYYFLATPGEIADPAGWAYQASFGLRLHARF